MDRFRALIIYKVWKMAQNVFKNVNFSFGSCREQACRFKDGSDGKESFAGTCLLVSWMKGLALNGNFNLQMSWWHLCDQTPVSSSLLQPSLISAHSLSLTSVPLPAAALMPFDKSTDNYDNHSGNDNRLWPNHIKNTSPCCSTAALKCSGRLKL